MLAAFFVIVNHTNSAVFLGTKPGPLWYLSLSYFFLSKSAVPIFLMITGALSLGKPADWGKSLKRFRRTLLVILLISVAYILYNALTDQKSYDLTQYLQAFLSGASKALWYLYLYAGLVLCMPLFQRLAQALHRKELLALIGICVGLGGLLPLLPIFTELRVSNYFFSGLPSVYIGLLFLGYYLHTYTEDSGKLALIGGLWLACMIALQVVLTRQLYNRDPESYLQLDSRTLLPITSGAAGLFLLMRHLFRDGAIGPQTAAWVAGCGSLTFGIYLFGDLFISILRKPLYLPLRELVQIPAAMLVYELAVFLCAGLLTALLRLIPPVRKFL